MPGGARFRYSITPNLFRVVAAPAGHSYLGVRAVEDEFGDITEIRLWLYQEGSFVEELAVLDASTLGVSLGDRTQMSRSMGMILDDPASLVGRCVHWGSAGGRIYSYDLDAETFYSAVSTAGGDRGAFAPIWGRDGWIYYFAPPGDSPWGFWSFHKIRANMSGDAEVSTLVAGPGELTFDRDIAHLAGSAYYVYSPAALSGGEDDRIGTFPLNGDPPSTEVATGMAALLSFPLHHGIPVGESAVFLRGDGGPLRLGIFSPPSTETLLWPDDWVAWEDPAGLEPDPEFDPDGILSLSLNPEGTEAVVYAAIPDGGGGRGILRTDLEAKTGAEPTGIVVVSAHEGEFPDFMLALD